MMNTQSTFQSDQKNKLSRQKDFHNPIVFFTLILKNWYFFVIAIAISLFGARLYINHTLPTYISAVTLLINETEDQPLVDNSELLQGLGLPGGMRNMENQIMILSSAALIERTLKDLPFETEFYYKTIVNELPIYPDSPIKILSEAKIPLPQNTEFSVTILDNNMFNLSSESKSFQLHKTASFGETIEYDKGTFRIECNNEEWLRTNRDTEIFFTIYSTARLINYFKTRLKVEKVNREGSVLRITLTGTNKTKDVDFLNKLVENFQLISLNKKNTEAERRIQFIDDQLIGISDSLLTTENKLQQFRSTHRVMDLSAQGQAIIGQVTLLENQRARLELEANYYDYLAEYLSKNVSGEIPLVPITMGITDPGLTRLVNELTELQGQLSARGAGELNPLQRNLEQRIRSTKDALRETLNGLKRANSLARSENQEQITRANSQASALPVTERQLLGIERKFKLNDELYTFLLETRAQQQMQKASNRADSEVIDPADERFSKFVSPIPVKFYAIGLFFGFGITYLIVFMRFLLNKKLDEEDIRQIADIPIVGNIPHNTEKTNTIVINHPGSTISEAYRLLRSRMQFFTKETSSPVIVVSSAMPGDGKTFTSINLASAYSLLGKKTVLVGFDLRKPKIYQDFNLPNEKGVSTWLIGKDKIKDIIQETSYENLAIISAGPIPPNPSELTALGKTQELIDLLREQYDYIIVDSSPMGIVSDTLHLASMADACIIVVRPGQTIRDMLEITLNEINSSRLKGACIVINDIHSDSKHYGYGEKYGYTSDQHRSKPHFSVKKKMDN